MRIPHITLAEAHRRWRHDRELPNPGGYRALLRSAAWWAGRWRTAGLAVAGFLPIAAIVLVTGALALVASRADSPLVVAAIAVVGLLIARRVDHAFDIAIHRLPLALGLSAASTLPPQTLGLHYRFSGADPGEIRSALLASGFVCVTLDEPSDDGFEHRLTAWRLAVAENDQDRVREVADRTFDRLCAQNDLISNTYSGPAWVY